MAQIDFLLVVPRIFSESLNGWSEALTVNLAVWAAKTAKTKAPGGGRNIFYYLILKWGVLVSTHCGRKPS